MAKELSLADVLELEDPAEHPRHNGTRIDEQKLSRMTPKQFARGILQSPEFRTYIKNGIVAGDIPSAIVLRLMDVAGWPVKNQAEPPAPDNSVKLTPEQIEDRLARVKRMTKLVRAAQTKEEDPGGAV